MLVDILVYYLIFAVSGGILSTIEHYIPIRNLIKEEGIEDHPFINAPIIGAIVWMGAAILFIPKLVLPLLVDSAKQKFITHTYQITTAD